MSETAAVPFVINPVGALSELVSKVLGDAVWVTTSGSLVIDAVKLNSDGFGDRLAPRTAEGTMFERLETRSKI